eukprot:scaffold15934_cov52-Cyclotella_meneghiniana.AAC.18
MTVNEVDREPVEQYKIQARRVPRVQVPRVDFQGCSKTRLNKQNNGMITHTTTSTREAQTNTIWWIKVISSCIVRLGCDDPALHNQINHVA